MTICQRSRCSNVGTHSPVLFLSAVGHPEMPPAEVSLGLAVCRDCQAKVGVWDIIDEDAWKELRQVFLASGRVEPSKENIGLTWRSLAFVDALFKRPLDVDELVIEHPEDPTPR